MRVVKRIGERITQWNESNKRQSSHILRKFKGQRIIRKCRQGWHELVSKLKDTGAKWTTVGLFTWWKKNLGERQLWNMVMGRGGQQGYSVCSSVPNVTGLIWLVKPIFLYWSSDPGVSAAAPLKGSALLKDDPGEPGSCCCCCYPGPPRDTLCSRQLKIPFRLYEWIVTGLVGKKKVCLEEKDNWYLFIRSVWFTEPGLIGYTHYILSTSENL